MNPEVHDLPDRIEIVEITTIGRTTGEPRRLEIWMYALDGRYIITGTPGPRDWYANLQADPRLILHLKDELVTDLPALAVPILDPQQRRAVLTAPETEWYRGEADLEAMVASSPMVKLVFRDLENGSGSAT